MRVNFIFMACFLMSGYVMAGAELSEKYPGPWQENFDQRITKTLAVNGIRGCGQYKFKEDSKKSKSYIVYCSRDGQNWLAYIVWAASEKVMGPYAPDPSLN